MSADQADLITSWTDARELLREVLLSGGPLFGGLIALIAVIAATLRPLLQRAWPRGLVEHGYIAGALDEFATRRLG